MYQRVAVSEPAEPRRPTREQVKFHRCVMAAMARVYAPGREDRIAAAKAKRDRKDAKRAREAEAIVRSTCASATK
jgi:hypothetical protein